MGLAGFIRSNENQIVEEWEAFARTCKPAADKLSSSLLRDHIRDLLKFIADELVNYRRKEESCNPKIGENKPAEKHGELRFKVGFDIIQLYSEYRALRRTVFKLWSADWVTSNKEWSTPSDIIPDLMRFNEVIDELISESLASYVERSGCPIIHLDISQEKRPV
jgi:hypothetical protein